MADGMYGEKGPVGFSQLQLQFGWRRAVRSADTSQLFPTFTACPQVRQRVRETVSFSLDSVHARLLILIWNKSEKCVAFVVVTK